MLQMQKSMKIEPPELNLSKFMCCSCILIPSLSNDSQPLLFILCDNTLIITNGKGFSEAL